MKKITLKNNYQYLYSLIRDKGVGSMISSIFIPFYNNKRIIDYVEEGESVSKRILQK